MPIALADVIHRHGPCYVERHGASMLPSHTRALRDIALCRTAELGGHVAECTHCGREHLLHHSCGNRACPRCGHASTVAWIERQRQLLLPVRYYHVVFTLPQEMSRLVRSHQRELLSVLFRAAYESLAKLCEDPRVLGGEIGALAVLHTWTRTLEWHPHIHMLVPAVAIAPDGRTLVRDKARRKPFLVSVEALSEAFRGRFYALGRHAMPGVAFPDLPKSKRWVTHCKPAVQGADKVLDYLGRYVHRTALSGKAIVAQDDETVTFAYRRSGESRRRHMTLPAGEFLRRFLQHVPLRGFHRVRAFGLLHPSSRDRLRQLQLTLGAGRDSKRSSEEAESVEGKPSERRSRLRCRGCGEGTLRRVRRLSPSECLAWESRANEGAEERARAPP